MHNAKMIKHSRKKRLLATMLSVALLLSLPLPASASTGNINANVVEILWQWQNRWKLRVLYC